MFSVVLQRGHCWSLYEVHFSSSPQLSGVVREVPMFFINCKAFDIGLYIGVQYPVKVTEKIKNKNRQKPPSTYTDCTSTKLHNQENKWDCMPISRTTVNMATANHSPSPPPAL